MEANISFTFKAARQGRKRAEMAGFGRYLSKPLFIFHKMTFPVGYTFAHSFRLLIIMFIL
jgi:hypothetical protein